MAMRINRIGKTTQHLAFISISTNEDFITSILRINRKKCIPLIQWKCICSNVDTRTIEASLVSIFTKRPFPLQSPELQELTSKLTPQTVETVLKSLRNWSLAELFFNWASNQEGYSHSCYTYNAMAFILSTARQNAPLRSLADKILNSSIFWTPGALGYLLRCLGSLGLVEEANSLFDQVKSSGFCVLNNYTYSCLLEVISKSGDVNLIECRLNEMRSSGWPMDKHALTPVLQCYCNAGEFEKALMVFNQLHEKGWVDQHVLTILVLSYSKFGKVDMAFDLIEWTERNLNTKLNEKTICVLIHGFVSECRVDRALHLYDKMKRVGYQPDISVYDVLISVLCKNKEIEKAMILYSHMKESGISPDVRILSHIISCTPEVNDMFRLLEDYFTSLEVGKRMMVYNSLLASLVKYGFADKAYHLLTTAIGSRKNCSGDAESNNLITSNPDTVSFQTVIDGLCKADKLDLALDLFHEMDRCGFKRSVLIFNNLIHFLSIADRLNECIDLLQEMEKSELHPTHFTFNTIFGCLCRREDIAGALDMVKKMRVHGHEPWIKHYTLLVKKLCEKGKASEAREFLSNITREGFLPNMIAYSANIDGFINTNELDNGLELFREVCERGYQPDVVAYNIIIKGLCREKRIIEAEKIVNEMRSKRLVPSVVTYNLLIDAWCKVCDINQAMACFSRMLQEEQEPSVITYASLVDGLCNVGKPEIAVSVWNEMEFKGCDMNRIAYMVLVHGLCKCKKPDVALIYLNQMENKNMTPDSYIYKALADAFLLESNSAMASEILEKMGKHNRTVS